LQPTTIIQVTGVSQVLRSVQRN